MAINNEEVVSTLNDLIVTCKDGQNGYQTAAENVDHSEYKTLFKKYCQQRAGFANELQTEVKNHGGDPEDSGSISASLHRGWMNIKTAVTGDDIEDIISECEEGEDAALENYKDALEKDLPTDVQSLVKRQRDEVQEAHDNIRSIEKKVD